MRRQGKAVGEEIHLSHLTPQTKADHVSTCFQPVLSFIMDALEWKCEHALITGTKKLPCSWFMNSICGGALNSSMPLAFNNYLTILFCKEFFPSVMSPIPSHVKHLQSGYLTTSTLPLNPLSS